MIAALLCLSLVAEEPKTVTLPSLREKAQARFGAPGVAAAEKLFAGMPERDRTALAEAFLLDEIGRALKTRTEFPWGKSIPDDIFFNDVLPYAVLDETRDPWRQEFHDRFGPLVKDCKTAGEAAQTLNREIFKSLNVHYNTGRKRANQSWKESAATGRATCTGLSIILVNACRSVGVPARAVGTAMWTNMRGNHTWVEVWDGDWKFTGADEYDSKGLCRGWFVEDASKALADNPKHAIFASSWQPAGVNFPLVWNPRSKAVAAVNVTSRYAKPTSTAARIAVRVVEAGKPGDARIAAALELCDARGAVLAKATSKTAPADLNDFAAFTPNPGRYTVRASNGTATQATSVEAVAGKTATVKIELPASGKPLSRAELDGVREKTVREFHGRLANELAPEMDRKAITVGGKTLRFLEKTFGDAPPTGRNLWISMHGGGNAPPRVNDRQWQNQIALYEPKEGVYIAPRAPTDTWNLWHEGHIDALFDRLIAGCVATKNVDPNRVYLMGYSAGGDGVWQLAPRMADRFAAASMMAGHPNDALQAPLRNLPFAIFMGGNDAAYGRNSVAQQKAYLMAELEASDPAGYTHLVRIYPGLGHWMQRKDAEALPWMASFKRDPWPKKVVWIQDDVVSSRFYWLELPKGDAASGQQITAEVEGQTVRIRSVGVRRLILRLDDRLLDLDKPIRVEWLGKPVFEGKVPRTVRALTRSLAERFDPPSAAAAELLLSLE